MYQQLAFSIQLNKYMKLSVHIENNKCESYIILTLQYINGKLLI